MGRASCHGFYLSTLHWLIKTIFFNMWRGIPSTFHRWWSSMMICRYRKMCVGTHFPFLQKARIDDFKIIISLRQSMRKHGSKFCTSDGDETLGIETHFKYIIALIQNIMLWVRYDAMHQHTRARAERWDQCWQNAEGRRSDDVEVTGSVEEKRRDTRGKRTTRLEKGWWDRKTERPRGDKEAKE